MKKILLLFTFVLISNSLYSQTLEERIAIRACECLSDKTKVDNEVYQNCISQSMTEVIFAESDTKTREVVNTVVGMQNVLKKVHKIMSVTCESEKIKASEAKRNQFYSDSKNEGAQNSFIIATDLMDDQKYKLAIEGYEIALKRDKNFVKAYDNIAICYRQHNDLDKAIKYYKKSLDIYPEGDVALMNIGVIYSEKSDFKTSIKYYNKLIKFHPKNAEGYFGAGKNYFLVKDYENALNNIFTAHRIYLEDKSDYIKDTELIIGTMYKILESENKEDLFNKIAEKHNISVN